jgi:hypothetical protein
MVTLRNSEGQIINGIDGWTPPAKGDKHWKDGRSAKELAKAWFRNGSPQIPDELHQILTNHPSTKNFNIEYGIPELETKLDNYKGKGRNHDLIIVGESNAIRTIISIEAKVDEEFGKVISKYIGESSKNEHSKVPNRIKGLSRAVFGDKDTSTLRYQLLHSVAGTLIEAKNREAGQAILIIHEFVPETGKSNDARRNERDLETFIRILTDEKEYIKVGKLIGPIKVLGGEKVPTDVPLYIGWIETVIG